MTLVTNFNARTHKYQTQSGGLQQIKCLDKRTKTRRQIKIRQSKAEVDDLILSILLVALCYHVTHLHHALPHVGA